MLKVIKRTLLVLGSLIILLILFGTVAFLNSSIHHIRLPTATGITAKQVCSLRFVSDLSWQSAYELYVRPLLGGAADHISISVGDSDVSVTFLGLYKQTAHYRPGLGCTLAQSGYPVNMSESAPNETPFQAMRLNQEMRESVYNTEQLDAALADAFKQGENTLAIVVLKNGQLVAEQYATDISRATPLPGWSMSKSLMATLAGVLHYKGEINLTDQLVLDCPDSNLDGQTLETLLTMTSGLNLIERNNGTDPNSNMLWTQGNMACFAAAQPSLHPPGQTFEYMSGNTVVAARFLQNHFGDNLEDQVKGIRDRVLAPMNIHSMIMEPDASGTIVGSSFVLATPQDWARLGQTYLDRGLANGTQMFATDWIDKVRETSERSRNRYGFGFWLGIESLPAGTLEMEGFQRQSVVIVPNEQLVVVRQGATNNGSADVAKLVEDIMGAQRYKFDP